MRRDLIALPDNSKVWIYQTERFVTDEQAQSIQESVITFSKNWLSHGQSVPAYGHFFHNRFLVLVADDSNHVSGCSIDSSVHFVQKLGNEYGLDFFDRLNFIYFSEKAGLKSIHSSQLQNAVLEERISGETLFFNNIVKTKKEFIESWVSPLKDCWMRRYLKAIV